MNYLKRLFRNYGTIINDFFAILGLCWTIIEVTNYFTNNKLDTAYKSSAVICWSIFAMLLFAIVKNLPKMAFKYKLRDKDTFIEVRVGDAFKNNGALIIPINDHFDVSLGGNVRKAKSLQNQLVRNYYAGREDHLSSDIGKKIDISKAPFGIGTTIEIEQENKSFFLVVNSKKKENNRVQATLNDFSICLPELWTFIATETGRHSDITMPIISTNHGRIPNINRNVAIKEIIDSYITASKALDIADKITISLLPDDIDKGEIDLDEIDDFLKFSCRNYRIVTLSNKNEGEMIDTPSIVENISR